MEQGLARGRPAALTVLSKEQILVCGTSGFPEFKQGSEMGDVVISVAVGDEFLIPLKTIATAGYVWKFDSLPDSIQVVKTVNQRDDAKPGDSNVQIFHFRALKAGEYTITFSSGSSMGKQCN